MLCIGITGSIGTGKSTVSNYLKDKGYIVIDADVISRQVSEKDNAGYNAIIKYFGKNILDLKGNIDRKKLSILVFENKENLEALNNILHPIILDEILKLKNYYLEKENIVFIDAALLIETGLYQYMDKVMLIHSDKEIQISRVMTRDKATLEKVERIINSQMTYLEKQKYADYILENNYDVLYLHKQIDKVLESLLKGNINV